MAGFTAALERSAAKALADRSHSPSDVERYLSALHLEDLALACACADGHEAAWEHFMMAYRPVLYRAADAIDPSGGARELADSIYADLYGLRERGGERQSLLRYFHGRSSLATWLRSVLSQRCVDRIRAARRVEPLPDEESPSTLAAVDPPPDPDRARLGSLLQRALADAIAALDPKDRLRLGCYYGHDMTLKAIGVLTGEHEATVSRHLTRTRRDIRLEVERRLRTDHHLSEREVDEAFARVVGDAGSIDLGALLTKSGGRKKSDVDRSTSEGML